MEMLKAAGESTAKPRIRLIYPAPKTKVSSTISPKNRV